MNKHWKTLGRIALILPLLALLVLSAAPPAQAADFRGDDVVIIAADEVIDDDLFAFGQRVEVNGTIKGDLFAFGREVVINGPVEGSLFVGAQEVEVNGTVDGSVYGGSYVLTVGPDVAIGRNMYYGGFSLETASGSTIGRSLYVGGYQLLAGGDVARDLRASLGALELNGNVGGDVVLQLSPTDSAGTVTPPSVYMPNMPVVEVVDPGVRFGPEAVVGGNLWYESGAPQTIPSTVVGGEVTYATPMPNEQAQPQPAPSAAPRDLGLGTRLFTAISTRVGEFIALLIVGGLLLRFWPEAVNSVSAQAQARPWRSAGWGLIVTIVFFILVPVAAIVIFFAAILGGLVTFGQLFSAILGLGAAALGLTVTTGLFILSLVTKAIVAFLVGRLVLKQLAPQALTGAWAGLLALALGAGMYEVLRAIPLGLGWVIGVIVTLLGVGAIYFVVRERLAGSAPAATPPTPVAA